MLGMIKKDVLLFMSNIKILVLTLVVFLGYSFANNGDFSYFIPFMVSMMTISLFSYDDMGNFHCYAMAFPSGRKNFVIVRYVSALFLQIVAVFIDIVVCFGFGLVNNSLDVLSLLSSIFSAFLIIIILLSILFPIMFKFGAEKGKIALFIVAFGILGIVELFMNCFKMNISSNLIDFVSNNIVLLLFIVSMFAFVLSYFISKKIYLKKEC